MIKFEGYLLRVDLIKSVSPIKSLTIIGILNYRFTIDHNNKEISFYYLSEDDAQAAYEELEAQIFDCSDNSNLAEIEKRLEAIESK